VREGVKRLVERIESLPTLPVVVGRLLQAANDPKTSASDIQRMLQYDQSLTMKVLRLANSSFYGSAGRIKTLSHAVVVLGFNTIRSIALSAGVFEAFGAKGSREFRREEFWRHSIAVGVAARLIAQRLGAPDPEEAFVAGVVHDVGKVALDRFAHDEFVAAIRDAKTRGIPIREAEATVLGASHDEVGRWIGAKWNLPAEHVEAIHLHHAPARAEIEPRLVAAIHMGDVVARACRIGWAGDDLVPPVDVKALAVLGLDEAGLKEVIERLPAEFGHAEAYVHLAGGGRAR